MAIGLKGEPRQEFDIEIADGNRIEKVVDFSSGEVVVGVTRNGQLSDATVAILSAGTTTRVSGGRTYTSDRHNPSTYRLTAGVYDVEVGAIEISGKPIHRWEGLVVEPGGRIEVAHDFVSGALAVGVRRDGELADATLNVVNLATGKSVAGGRTYVNEKSNPKRFILEPGEYRIDVREVRGEKARTEITVTVPAGGGVAETVDFP